MHHDQQHIVVIGGGASGALLACHLLRDATSKLTVSLVERDRTIGRGVAYTTVEPSHLLNVRAMNMSAFADDPEHFCRWLVDRDIADCVRVKDPLYFAPRTVYGRYISDLVAPHVPPAGGRLEIVRGEAVGLERGQHGVEVRLTDGRRIAAAAVVLATGHDGAPESQPAYYADPWQSPAQSGLHQGAPILVQGTGLTMIDYVLSLRANGHAAPIYAISRRGLLPTVHRTVPAIAFDPAEVPFGKGLLVHWRWIRSRIRDVEAECGDWRSVIDAVRPCSWTIWRSFPETEKQRFLRHARAWWDVRRHRMAPEVADEIRHALRLDQLRIIAGKIERVDEEDKGVLVTFRRRARRSSETLRVSRIVQCTGVYTDPRNSSNALIRNLLENGWARPDPLAIGLDVSRDGALIDVRGQPASDLFAVGPLTRAALWEIVAIPDIRVQCASLATHLTSQVERSALHCSRAV